MVEPITTALFTVAAKEAVKGLAKPLIDSAFKGATFLTEVVLDTFTNQFITYIDRQLEKHSYLNTLVFQNQVPLEELYIPLTVIKQEVGEENSQEEILINHFSKDFIPTHKRVLITDTAGMGKSTLLRYLLIHCIKSNFAIPIFVELRHLSEARSLLSLLELELNLGNPDGSEKFTKERIGKILKKGKMLFFFDGYDEIPFKDREAVTKDIKSFIESFPDNYYTLTSRPESGLSAFPSFAHFRIRPLKKPESFALITKYDKSGARSQQLIQRLEGPELSAVHEFLENPLLTTLLYRCFEYKQNIPEKKHVFYRQVFDALFDWHDASKDGYNTREKRSKLDLDEFHRVLRVVGFISVLNGEVEGDKDQVLSWIRDAKRVCVGLSFSESDFLQDASTAVPVLVKDGLYYKWSHKSLAEYFAAQYICTEGKEQQSKVFEHMRRTGNLHRFYNMLEQVYDLDQAAFRKYFTYPLAKDFLEFRANSYKKISPAVTTDEIEIRRGAVFCNPTIVSKASRVPGGPDLTKALSELNYKYEGKVGTIFDLNFRVTRIPVSNLKMPLVIIRLASDFSVIGEILSTKHDPIVISPQKLSARFKPAPIKNLGYRNIFPVTDDPDSVLNSPVNFEAVNRALLFGRFKYPVIDFTACEAFVRNFSDEQTKTDFTHSLLSKLVA